MTQVQPLLHPHQLEEALLPAHRAVHGKREETGAGDGRLRISRRARRVWTAPDSSRSDRLLDPGVSGDRPCAPRGFCRGGEGRIDAAATVSLVNRFHLGVRA